LFDRDLTTILQTLPWIVIGLTVHEFAHVFAADRLGDPTSRELGRYSLNPLRHIDPVGFVMLVLLGFGWAKPVVIDPARLRRPRRDEVLIATAGPAANLLLAFVFIAILKVALIIQPLTSHGFYEMFLRSVFSGVFLNVGLFVFNMIPLPPLDGSHVLVGLLPVRDRTFLEKFNRYGSYVFLALILADQFLKIDILPIGPAVRWIVQALAWLVGGV
jgi:Zn-dependent protease